MSIRGRKLWSQLQERSSRRMSYLLIYLSTYPLRSMYIKLETNSMDDYLLIKLASILRSLMDTHLLEYCSGSHPRAEARRPPLTLERSMPRVQRTDRRVLSSWWRKLCNPATVHQTPSLWNSLLNTPMFKSIYDQTNVLSWYIIQCDL